MLHEIIAIHTGVRFPVVAVSFTVVAVIYLFSGNNLRFMQTPFALPWIALLVWCVLAGSVGFYRGQSLPYLLPYALRIHTLPLILCALACDARNLRKVLYGAGFGLIALLIICRLWGQTEEGRFFIPDTNLGNSNDLALRLLMSASLFMVFWGGGFLKRLTVIVTLPVMSYYLLRTGSRANLVTVMVMLALCFLLLPLGKKALLVAISAVVLVAAVPFLPQTTADRLTTFFSTSSEFQDADSAEVAESAVASTAARMALQARAIELTLQHPLLGVGALNFENAVEDMVQKREHRKSGWQVSHNSYLQVSSENGIPGLIFYVWLIVLCLWVNYRNFRRTSGQAALASFSILLSSVAYAVGVLFCSIAYDYYLAVLVGLTAANDLILRREQGASVPNLIRPIFSGGQTESGPFPLRNSQFRVR